jgi:hypothetical protein
MPCQAVPLFHSPTPVIITPQRKETSVWHDWNGSCEVPIIIADTGTDAFDNPDPDYHNLRTVLLNFFSLWEFEVGDNFAAFEMPEMLRMTCSWSSSSS